MLNTPPSGVAYPRILRTETWQQDWWRPVLGSVVLGSMVFVFGPFLMSPIVYAGAAIEARLGDMSYAEALSRSTSVGATPSSMLWLNLSLALAVLVAWGLVRALHNLKPRWLASVSGGIRWRFFIACFGLSLVAIMLQLVLSNFLPVDEMPGSTGGEVNHFGGLEIALAVVILLTTPLQAIGEEYAFRGYLLQALGSLFGSWPGIVLTALLFACAHGIQNAPLFLDRFAFGLIAGVLVHKSGGLEAGIALHIMNNLFAFGLALLFGDVAQALTVSEVSWWNLPLTVVQNGGYLLMVLLLLRKMRLPNVTGSTLPGPGTRIGEQTL